jgi:hypothetical protein
MQKSILGLTNDNFEPEQRFFIFKRLYETDHDLAYNTIHTLCDLLNHLKDEKHSDCILLLEILVRSNVLNAIEKMFIAVSLFNNGLIKNSFDCFKSILATEKIDYVSITESIKYLYCSEEFDDTITEIILQFIKNYSFSSEKRYKLLDQLFHNNGVKMYFNSQKLYRQINFDIAVSLFSSFFFDSENDIEYRLLCVKKLVSLKSIFNKEINLSEIFKKLFELCNDTSLSEKIRFNAADTIYRSGSEEEQKQANDILVILQESKNKKSIYDNSQNVHSQSILESVEKFLFSLVSDITVKANSIDLVILDITDLIKSSNLDEKDYFSAFKSLNRISIDFTLFTKYNFSLSEILCKVWKKIQLSDKKEFLSTRLIQELIDMSEWNTGCSTGFASRLVNIFSGTDDTITISWKEQIQSNIKGRIEAKIRDSDIQEELLAGMLPNSQERDIYLCFINSIIDNLKKEMKTEFLEYVKEQEFEDIFLSSIKNWI